MHPPYRPIADENCHQRSPKEVHHAELCQALTPFRVNNGIMLFGNLRLSVLSAPPIPEYPSTFAVYIESVNSYVAGSDTVRVREAEDCPSIVGRVTTVVNDVKDIPADEAMHPFLLKNSPLPSTSKPIRLQWHFVNNNEHYLTTNRFWGRPSKLRRACGDIEEAAPTNCVIWVSSCQISQIVYFIHRLDCENQIYGPVHHRTNTFLIRFVATFQPIGNNPSFNIEEIPHCDFASFPTASTTGTPATCTERQLEFLLAECQLSQDLLTKSGKLASSVSKTTPMSREKAEWLQSQLASVDTNQQSTGRTKQCISHSNLSIEAAVLPTTKITIRACSSADFNELRELFHSGYGTGVRKKFPPIKDLALRNLNPSRLRHGDTINVSDAPLYNYSIEDTSGWFDANAAQTEHYTRPNRNFIRWVYNSRSRSCRVTMKCCAVVAGACNAAFLNKMLDRIEIDWGERPITCTPGNALYVGQAIEIDGFPWRIQQLATDRNIVTLCDEDTGDIVTHTFAFVAANTM